MFDIFTVTAIGVIAVLCLTIWRSLKRKGRPQQPSHQEHVIVDGSNDMYWGGDPSFATLRAVVSSLKDRQLHPIVIFDANVGYKLFEDYKSDTEMAGLLGLASDQVQVVPRGYTADEEILLLAKKRSARVVSNDRFRDWTVKHPWVRKKGRVIRGTYHQGAVKWR